MALLTLSLTPREYPIAALTRQVPSGDHFIVLRFGGDVSVLLPGVNEEALSSARQIIAALSDAIFAIEKATAQDEAQASEGVRS